MGSVGGALDESLRFFYILTLVPLIFPQNEEVTVPSPLPHVAKSLLQALGRRLNSIGIFKSFQQIKEN